MRRHHFHLMFSRSCLLFLLGALIAAAPAASSADESWLFAADEKRVRVLERADAIGLTNGDVAFLLRRDDGALLGLWQKGRPNLIGEKLPTPLWSFEMAPAG